MKALVTGGGGFLGRWIVKQLLERGDSVRVLGRRDYPDLKALNVETVKCNLNDTDKISEACKGVDAVFHVASLTGIWGKPSAFFETNVIGTENIIRGCRKQGVKKLVYTSTPSVVYGTDPIRNGNENLHYPEKYLAVYPETKAIAEKTVIKANGADGLLTCSIRPHLIWGPGDTNLIPRMVDRAKKGRLMKIGDGSNKIGVVYVENAALAHLNACDRLVEGSPVPGQCYFITESEPVNCWNFIGELLEGLSCPPVKKTISTKAACRIGYIFEMIYKLFGITKEPPMTRFLALQLATDHWFDISKAITELGWESQVSVNEGMRKLFEAWPSKRDQE